MLSYRTIEPHTLELLRALTAEPLLQGLRLVGGTAYAQDVHPRYMGGDKETNTTGYKRKQRTIITIAI